MPKDKLPGRGEIKIEEQGRVEICCTKATLFWLGRFRQGVLNSLAIGCCHWPCYRDVLLICRPPNRWRFRPKRSARPPELRCMWDLAAVQRRLLQLLFLWHPSKRPKRLNAGSHLCKHFCQRQTASNTRGTHGKQSSNSFDMWGNQPSILHRQRQHPESISNMSFGFLTVDSQAR